MKILKKINLHLATGALIVLMQLLSPTASRSGQADLPATSALKNDPIIAATTIPARPFVLLTSNELTELRDALTSDSYRSSLYQQSIKSTADDWVTRTVSIPERGGYYHDFTCTDGTRLTQPESLLHCEPIPAGQHYKCSTCGQQYSGKKFDDAMRCLQHNDLMATARNLALVGAVENDRRYTDKAAEILIAYANAYPGRHTSALKGGILYQSLDEAVHFIYLAQAYDLVVAGGLLSEADKDRICQKLLWECAEGLIQCGLGGNWGSWHLSAVGVIGFATGQQRFIDYGISNFKKQIAEQLGDDGLWPESVHTYHFYPMRGFLQLAEAALPTGIDLYNWEAEPGKSLKAMFTQPVHYAYPNLQLPAINDGWFQSYLPVDIYEVGYHRLRLPLLGWVVNESRRLNTREKSGSPDVLDVWSVLHGVPVEQAPEQPNLASTNFDTIGICTLRHGLSPENETMLTFDYGRFLGHGQPEKMGITLYAKNQLLMADYGTPSYGSSILPFYTGTASHNTIMIDGTNQARTKSHGLLAFIDKPELKAAVAETTEVANGVTWGRAVLLAPDYALIADYLDSNAEHQYDNLLHCVGDSLSIVTQAGSPATLVDISTNTLGIAYFDATKAITDSEISSATAIWSRDELPLQKAAFVMDPPAKIFTAVCPADSGTSRILALVQRIHAKQAMFANVLPIADAEPPEVTIEGKQITVKGAGFTDTVTSATTGLTWRRTTGDGSSPVREVEIPYSKPK